MWLQYLKISHNRRHNESVKRQECYIELLLAETFFFLLKTTQNAQNGDNKYNIYNRTSRALFTSTLDSFITIKTFSLCQLRLMCKTDLYGLVHLCVGILGV